MSDGLLSPERLAEIRGRLAAATRGPWRVNGRNGHHYPVVEYRLVDGHHSSVLGVCEVWHGDDDAAFIASAPTDIAALLAHIDALTALAKELAAEVKEWDSYCHEFEYLEEHRPTDLLAKARAAGLLE